MKITLTAHINGQEHHTTGECELRFFDEALAEFSETFSKYVWSQLEGKGEETK